MAIIALLPFISALNHDKSIEPNRKSETLKQNATLEAPLVRTVRFSQASSNYNKLIMGDPIGLETALNSHRDLMPAAGEHKKYILVKKKPKHKKIKMEVYKPKMKYKKIKMKVPVKKMKKKKVKGYLVKKEKHGYH